VIEGYADQATEDLHRGRNTKAARKRLPQVLHFAARRKLSYIDYAPTLNDLRLPPGNRLEALSGARKGQHSIRINHQYRICFRWNGGHVTEVEVVDYH